MPNIKRYEVDFELTNFNIDVYRLKEILDEKPWLQIQAKRTSVQFIKKDWDAKTNIQLEFLRINEGIQNKHKYLDYLLSSISHTDDYDF